MADNAFKASIDGVHLSGKINGLMQAQVIALEYAGRYGAGSLSAQASRRIADEIEKVRIELEAEQAQP